MILEQQVVSLELSKKLKELGVKQESIFYWLVIDEPPQSSEVIFAKPNPFELAGSHLISAFTCSELIGLLPYHKLEHIRWGMGSFFSVTCESQTIDEASSPSNALSKMLVNLIKQGIVKP